MKNLENRLKYMADFMAIQRSLMSMALSILDKHNNLGIPIEDLYDEEFEEEKKMLFRMTENDEFPDGIYPDLKMFENAQGYLDTLKETTLMFVKLRLEHDKPEDIPHEKIEEISEMVKKAVEQKALYFSLSKVQN